MSMTPQVPKEQLAFLLADLVRESADVLLRGEQELTLNTDWLLYLSTRFPRQYPSSSAPALKQLDTA